MSGPLILMGDAAAACVGGVCDLPDPAAKSARTPPAAERPDALAELPDAPAQSDGADAGDEPPVG